MPGLIFTYLAGYGGALASLAFPFVGLLIYVCFGILKPEYLWYDSVPEGNFSRIVAVGLIIGWVMQGMGRWRIGKALAILAAFVSFWLWSILSAAVAAHPEKNWLFVIDLGKILLTFVIGLTLIDSVKKLKLLAWVIVLSQACVAAVLELDSLQGFNRAKEVGFAGLDNNALAITMVTCFGLVLFLAVAQRHWGVRTLCITLALLIAHVVVISDSRGGMLALLATVASCFVLAPWRPGTFAIMFATMLVVLVLTGAIARQRFMTIFASEQTRDESAEGRLKLWQDNIDVTLRNPIFGCGPYGWPLLAEEYGWPPGKEGHSLWLQTAAELGIPGALLLVSFYVLLVRRLWSIARATDEVADPWLTNAARGVIASIVGFVVSAQFVTVSTMEMPFYVALLGAGLLKVVSVRWETATVAPPTHRSASPHTQLVNA